MHIINNFWYSNRYFMFFNKIIRSVWLSWTKYRLEIARRRSIGVISNHVGRKTIFHHLCDLAHRVFLIQMWFMCTCLYSASWTSSVTFSLSAEQVWQAVDRCDRKGMLGIKRTKSEWIQWKQQSPNISNHRFNTLAPGKFEWNFV